VTRLRGRAHADRVDAELLAQLATALDGVHGAILGSRFP
jgi:hypothetical protein